MAQIKVIGHGILREYTREEIQLSNLKTIENILNSLDIKTKLRDSLLIVKNGKAVSLFDEVDDGDELELFILVSGG